MGKQTLLRGKMVEEGLQSLPKARQGAGVRAGVLALSHTPKPRGSCVTNRDESCGSTLQADVEVQALQLNAVNQQNTPCPGSCGHGGCCGSFLLGCPCTGDGALAHRRGWVGRGLVQTYLQHSHSPTLQVNDKTGRKSYGPAVFRNSP